MPNRVEVLFEVDPGGAGKRELREFAGAMTDLQEAALDAGVPIDSLINKVRGLDTRQVDAITRGIRGLKNETKQAADEMARLQASGPRALLGTGVGPAATSSPADRVLARKFDQSARDINSGVFS